MVQKQFGRFVKQIHVEYDYYVITVLYSSFQKNCLNKKKTILLGTYLPPSNSFYKDCEIENGVTLVEKCIFDIIEQQGELPFLVFCDLNARTGTANANEDTRHYFGYGK